METMVFLMSTMRIIREDDETVEDFCYKLYNMFGAANLCLAYNYIKDGELVFSKHIPYGVLMSLDFNDIVPHTPDTRTEFFKKVQHRTVLDVEVLFDIDNAKIDEISFATIKDKAFWIYCTLKQEGYLPIMSWTGSKSYHISIVLPELRKLDSYQRTIFKEKMLERFGADLNKKSEHCMVALELATHYKSGKKKLKVV